MIRRFVVLTLLIVAAACAHVQETSAPVGEGRRVFQDQGCYGCHTVGATGAAKWTAGADASCWRVTGIAARVTDWPLAIASCGMAITAPGTRALR